MVLLAEEMKYLPILLKKSLLFVIYRNNKSTEPINKQIVVPVDLIKRESRIKYKTTSVGGFIFYSTFPIT